MKLSGPVISINGLDLEPIPAENLEFLLETGFFAEGKFRVLVDGEQKEMVLVAFVPMQLNSFNGVKGRICTGAFEKFLPPSKEGT